MLDPDPGGEKNEDLCGRLCKSLKKTKQNLLIIEERVKTLRSSTACVATLLYTGVPEPAAATGSEPAAMTPEPQAWVPAVRPERVWAPFSARRSPPVQAVAPLTGPQLVAWLQIKEMCKKYL